MNIYNINIFVAAQSKLPIALNSFYKPIFVGAELGDECLVKSLNYRDDIGENISLDNPKYCELTAIYWAWKNLKSDAVGLSHYRRYFLFNIRNYFNIDIMPFNSTDKEVISAINNFPDNMRSFVCNGGWIVAPEKNIIKSVSEYYMDDTACVAADWEVMRQVINELYPEYQGSLEKYIKNNKLRHYNMFITSWSNFSKYCDWIFKILKKIDNKLDYSNRNKTQMRVLGYIAERLLGLYLEHNNSQKLEIMVGYYNPDHRIYKIYKGNNIIFRQLIYKILQYLVNFKIISIKFLKRINLFMYRLFRLLN